MHQIRATIDGIHAALSDAADANPVFLSVEEKRAALVDLMRAEARVAELRLRIEADADDLVAQDGCRDVAAVITAAGLADPRTAHREMRLSRGLGRYERVRACLADGRFTREHATVIVHALDALPGDLRPGVVGEAEVSLCQLAEQHQPRELRILGQRILQVVDPDAADVAIAKALADEERDARQRARLSIVAQGDGTTKVMGLVPDAVGVRLRVVLESFAQPRKAALEADGATAPRHRLMAEALAQLLETLDPQRLPVHGGGATTVVVTIGLEALRSELGSGELSDDTLLSAGEIRRLACTADVLPAVLGGDSEILDLGRARRLFSPGQRKALRLRDRRCRAEGCAVPAAWCDAHHRRPWSRGGPTNVKDGVLLCGHHHRRAHDSAYDTSRLPNGDLRFHKRR